MIEISSKGYKVSSTSADLEPAHPLFKCPKCECVYGSLVDINSLFSEDNKTYYRERPMLCNECGTELESFK